MSASVSFKDDDWGCEHISMIGDDALSIISCKVSVTDLTKLSAKLTETVVDTSWMSDLDQGLDGHIRRPLQRRLRCFAKYSKKCPAHPWQRTSGSLWFRLGPRGL